jgi:hypothetical protein
MVCTRTSSLHTLLRPGWRWQEHGTVPEDGGNKIYHGVAPITPLGQGDSVSLQQGARGLVGTAFLK